MMKCIAESLIWARRFNCHVLPLSHLVESSSGSSLFLASLFRLRWAHYRCTMVQVTGSKCGPSSVLRPPTPPPPPEPPHSELPPRVLQPGVAIRRTFEHPKELKPAEAALFGHVHSLQRARARIFSCVRILLLSPARELAFNWCPHHGSPF